jgi:PhnB protein
MAQATAGFCPYIVCKGAAEAIAFYKKAFGAEETYRLEEPDGKIGHAELRINGGALMLADEYPDFGAVSPATLGGSPASLHLSVDDCDAWIARAVEAGCTLVRPPKDEFYGGRSGTVACPFGYRWQIMHMVEDIGQDEAQRRWNEMAQKGSYS